MVGEAQAITSYSTCKYVAVLADMVSDSNTITLVQEQAFETTAHGGIKATQLAGALFNYKDDKRGHHNVFCFWWQENVGSEFTFPDINEGALDAFHIQM